MLTVVSAKGKEESNPLWPIYRGIYYEEEKRAYAFKNAF